MYTDDQYSRAKAQIGSAPPEAKAILRQRIREYEETNPQHAAPEASGNEKLAQGHEEELTPEAQPGVGQVPKGIHATVGSASPFATDTSVDTDYTEPGSDPDLPNASKLKVFSEPPEYVSKRPLAGLSHIAGAVLSGKGLLTGQAPLAANLFHEPTEDEFIRTQGDVMQARGIRPGSPQWQERFAEYKDRKWKQAYDQAAADDRPLTRVAYAPQGEGWQKLGQRLLGYGDEVQHAFTRGLLMNTPSLAAAGVDAATRAAGKPTNYVEEGRENDEQSPLSNTAGNVASLLLPGNPLARLASGVTRGVTRGVAGLAGPGLAEAAADALEASPSALRKGAAAVAGGITASVADLGLRSAESGAGDAAHNGFASGAGTAKDQFIAGLPGALGTGAMFSLGGHAVAEGGNAFQKYALGEEQYPQLADLRRGGGETHGWHGITPGKEAAANLELARPAAPGEMKPELPGQPNATDIAAGKLQEPLTAENATALKEARQRIDLEKAAEQGRDPNLQKPMPATSTAQTTLDWFRRFARGQHPLGGVLSEDTLPATDIAEVKKLIPQLVKPRLVNVSDASSQAGRLRGPAITLDEARELGIPTGGLQSDLNAEGVPHNAPPAPEEPAPAGQNGLDILGPAGGGPAPFIGPRRMRVQPPRSYEPPAPSDWRDPATERARFDFMYHEHATPDPFPMGKPDDVTPTRATNPGPLPKSLLSHGAPQGPPPEIAAAPKTPATSTAGLPPASIGGVPESQFRVILEPKAFNADEFEGIVGNVDRKANAGTARDPNNPIWKELQRAVRQDREQFGPKWADLIAGHHKFLNSLETRAADAGIRQNVPYSEMLPDLRKAHDTQLEGYPTGPKARIALTSLASSADARAANLAKIAGEAPTPGVLKDLETLGTQNAYTVLHGQAVPKLGETVGAGGLAGHIRGLGPFVKLRAEALSRGVSAGPTGEPTITPRVLDYVQRNGPRTKFLPGMSAMGGGALGLKAGVTYNSLTPEQKRFLEKLVTAAQPAAQQGQ